MNKEPHTRSSILLLHSNTERGAAMVMFAAAILALLATAALALDVGHAMLNKTRLQNILDSAALEAAKTLDLTRDTNTASQNATSAVGKNLGLPGNHELAEAYAAREFVVVTEFSDSIDTFTPGGVAPRYVRVRADNVPLNSWFLQVFGIDKNVGATAVAGPSPTLGTVCDIAPLMICGDPDQNDPDASPPMIFGYEMNSVVVLKMGSGQQGGCVPGDDNCSDEPGPGNFQLLALNCTGGSPDCLRANLAGAYQNCLSTDDEVTTEPGNSTGPVAAGINTRFGCYGNGNNNLEEYPPDKVTCRGTAPDYTDYDYPAYQAAEACPGDGTNNHLVGIDGRRILKVPIVDCEGHDINGRTDIPTIGYGCFFLLDAVPFSGPTGCGGNGGGGGGGGQSSKIIGQFIEECGTRGVGGPDPGASNGPYLIQLYKDPGNEDS